MLALPTYRELLLVFLAAVVFLVTYTADISLHAASSIASTAYLGTTTESIQMNGPPVGWRNRLKYAIFGEWAWSKGHLAGDGTERERLHGVDNKYGAEWMDRSKVLRSPDVFGSARVGDAFVQWNGKIPKTRVVKHIPGYTVLDSVIMVNGTIFIVTDTPQIIPVMDDIFTSHRGLHWQIISPTQGSRYIGDFSALIRGVSFIANDRAPCNHTLLSLWRAYSTLDPNISSDGETLLPPPRRLIFPLIPYFAKFRPKPGIPGYPQSKTGINPYEIKASFPYMDLWYQRDWNDLTTITTPWLFERVVVADRAAATASREKISKIQRRADPDWSGPFLEWNASRYWFEPVRKAFTGFMHAETEPEPSQTSLVALKDRSKRIVTYLSMQGNKEGPTLSEVDHSSLVTKLKALGDKLGYTFEIATAATPWMEKADYLTRTTILLGVFGDNMVGSYLLAPKSVIMEFFVAGEFWRETELPARSLDIRYMAWQNTQVYSKGVLPRGVPPNRTLSQVVPIHVDAIVEAVRKEMAYSNHIP